MKMLRRTDSGALCFISAPSIELAQLHNVVGKAPFTMGGLTVPAVRLSNDGDHCEGRFAMSEMRTCVGCGQTKDAVEFRKYKDRNTLINTCLQCRRLACACGCGEYTSGYFNGHSRDVPRFVFGHHTRTADYKALARKGRNRGKQKGNYAKSVAWKEDASRKKLRDLNPMYGQVEHMRHIASQPGTKNPRFGSSSPHGKGQWYQRKTGARIWLRSTWEVAFATWLDGRELTWEYESRRFDLGEQTYAPDFWIEEWQSFWEVKGWFHSKHQRTVKLFRELYPHIVLVVATKPVLEATIGKRL